MAGKHMLTLFVSFAALSGCASSDQTSSRSTHARAPKAPVRKVALASLIVRNYGPYGSIGMIPSALIADNMDNVLASTERIIAAHWSVTPVTSFIHLSDYTTLGKGSARANYFTPAIEGKNMPILFSDSRGFTKGAIDKGTARALCTVLSVDAIVLVYSEWSVQSGKFVPTIKALTRNCITVYDKAGEHVFFGRKDTLGPHPLGGPFGGVHINEDTIDHWLEAFETGVKTVLERHHKKLR